MKNMLFIIISTGLILLTSFSAYSNSNKEICIKTNLHCESCASRIETKLGKAKGVVKYKADVDTKIVTVEFESGKTNENNIVKIIKKLGYEAEIIQPQTKNNTKSSSNKNCCDTKATKSAPQK